MEEILPFPQTPLTILNMRFYIFLFLIVGCVSFVNAQSLGVVIDEENGFPLTGVNIYMEKDSIGIAVTDGAGQFKTISTEKCDENAMIVFSHIGYFPVKYTLKELRHLSYQIRMSTRSQKLAEVTVEGKYGRIFWNYESLCSLPKALYAFGSFLLNGKIYVVSGDETSVTQAPSSFAGYLTQEYLSKKMFIYDIVADTWTESEHDFIPRTGHSAHYYKGKIFVVGGKYFSISRGLEYTEARVEVYDLERDTVYIDKVNPHQAVNPITFIYEDCLYVMGGTVKKNFFSDKMHILDLKTGIWYDAGITIPKERRGNTRGVLIGNIVYLVGGYNKASMWTIRGYNLQTGDWLDLCELKENVTYPGVAVNGNLIYIYENTTLQVYDIKLNKVDIYHFTDGFESASLFYADGKLYIVGGCLRDSGYIYPSDEVFSVDVSHISNN